MGKNNDEQEVLSFVANFIGAKPDSLSVAMTLQDDLGMDGDDALEFMTSFSNNFQVDISNFIFSNYFGEERPFLLRGIIKLLFPDERRFKPLSILDLVNARNRGFIK